jgi:hypothetical protein
MHRCDCCTMLWYESTLELWLGKQASVCCFVSRESADSIVVRHLLRLSNGAMHVTPHATCNRLTVFVSPFRLRLNFTSSLIAHQAWSRAYSFSNLTILFSYRAATRIGTRTDLGYCGLRRQKVYPHHRARFTGLKEALREIQLMNLASPPLATRLILSPAKRTKVGCRVWLE